MEDPHALLDVVPEEENELYADEVMDHVAWRRSAVEFLPELVAEGPEPSEHAAELQDLARAAREFDAALLDQFKPGSEEKWLESGGLVRIHPPRCSPEPPEGLPESHWWWAFFKELVPKTSV